VQDVAVLRTAAVPTLTFGVRIEAAGGRSVRGLGLNVRLQIAAQRRRHGARERKRLRELFGDSEQWARSLNPVPWADASLNVPGFDAATTVELRVACTYDFDVAAAKYLAALEGGEIPLELLFSGTVFFTAPDGRLQTALVPWDRGAPARMPVAVWRDAMRSAFGDTPWLRVQRDVFERLQAERSRRGFATWEQTLDALLTEAAR
jgi:hypothetical protein